MESARGNDGPQTERPELAQLERLRKILARPRRLRGWSEAELLELPRLYRHACSQLARSRSGGEDPHLAAEARALVRAAHGVLFRERSSGLGRLPARAVEFFLRDCPRAIRAEWRLLALTCALFYGLAALAWIAV